MAGLTPHTPTPTQIVLHTRSRALELGFSDGASFRLPFELLRVYSPSAEVRGHGPGQEILQVGKREVTIERLQPVGHYALQPEFSDGHSTGIYSWDYLYDLGARQDVHWAAYLDRLKAAGASRDPAPNNGPVIARSGPAPDGAETATAGLNATALSRPRS